MRTLNTQLLFWYHSSSTDSEAGIGIDSTCGGGKLRSSEDVYPSPNCSYTTSTNKYHQSTFQTAIMSKQTPYIEISMYT